MRISSLAFVIVLCAACSGSTSNTGDMYMSMTGGDMPKSGDMTADMCMTPASCCGFPGDMPVNNFGVGKYCMTGAECVGVGKTTVCSSVGNTSGRKTFFCTFLCMRGTTDCGTNATCQCDSGGAGCACTPTSCVNSPPACCSI